MSIYQDIEAAVVARLAPFGSVGFEVVALPETQSDYSRPFVNGKITVAYHSSSYDKPNSIGHMSQYEEISVIVSIQSRFLRGDKGIYSIASIVRKALLGFEPAGYWRMWAKEFGLKDAKLEDGLWTYYGLFCTKALAVEDFEEDISNLISQISYDNDLTGETFSVGNDNTPTP